MAPVEAVWALLADVTTWATWSSFNESSYAVVGVPAPHGVGAQRAFRSGPFRSVDTVLTFDPPTRLSYGYRGPLPIKNYRADVVLTPLEAGTRITWHSEFSNSLPLVGPLMRLLLGKVLGDLATALARSAEHSLAAKG